MSFPAAARRNTGDDLRTVLDALLGVERPLVAGNALTNDSCFPC